MTVVDEVLEALVADTSFTPDWREVLDRADVGRPRAARSPRRRLALGLAALAAALIVIGSALGAAGIGPLSPIKRWLEGTPGKPASRSATQAFRAANGHSWASFPRSTQLRELIARNFGGQRYVLYGFRSGSSVCLTLKGVTLGSSLPPACAPVSVVEHLSAPVVVVTGNGQVPAFPERRSPHVSFGIAADQVRQVTVETVDGDHRAAVGGNAYLWVDTSPASYDFVRSLRIATASGKTVVVSVPRLNPLVSPLEPTVRHGPSHVTETIQHPQIGWLQRGEKRGLSPARAHLTVKQLQGLSLPGSLRLFKPDPTSDIVVGIDGGCLYLDNGLGCSAPNQFFSRGPVNFMLSGGGQANSSDQFLELGGAAADGVAAVRAVLPDGTSLQLALKDNMFAGVVPNMPPIRVVAYARDGKIVGIEPLGGSRPTPTPARRLQRVLTTHGAGGVQATLWLGPVISNIRCWKVATSVGRQQGQCERIPLTGPWVTLEGVQATAPAVFVFGYTRPPISRVFLRFDDGTRVSARLARGWFVAAVPARQASTVRRHARVLGVDKSGIVVQQPAFFYKL